GILFTDLLDNGVERPTRFAFEVEELHQRGSVRSGIVEHMRVRAGTRQGSLRAGFGSVGASHHDDDERHDREGDEDGTGDEGDLDRGLHGGLQIGGVVVAGARASRQVTQSDRTQCGTYAAEDIDMTIQGLLTNLMLDYHLLPTPATGAAAI